MVGEPLLNGIRYVPEARGSISYRVRQRGGDDFPYCPGLLLDKFTAADNVTGGYTVLFIWALAYPGRSGLTICARPVSRNCQLPSWRNDDRLCLPQQVD
jgi:hypothetical protein